MFQTTMYKEVGEDLVRFEYKIQGTEGALGIFYTTQVEDETLLVNKAGEANSLMEAKVLMIDHFNSINKVLRRSGGDAGRYRERLPMGIHYQTVVVFYDTIEVGDRWEVKVSAKVMGDTIDDIGVDLDCPKFGMHWQAIEFIQSVEFRPYLSLKGAQNENN